MKLPRDGALDRPQLRRADREKAKTRGRSLRTLLFFVPLALSCGCAFTQNVPVSTQPSGAAVHPDGALVCSATPCSVAASTDQAHLLTIMLEGYQQEDIPLRQVPAQTGAGSALAPDVVTARRKRPDEADARDPDALVDEARNLSVDVLKHGLKNAEQGLDR